MIVKSVGNSLWRRCVDRIFHVQSGWTDRHYPLIRSLSVELIPAFHTWSQRLCEQVVQSENVSNVSVHFEIWVSTWPNSSAPNAWRNRKVTHATGASQLCILSPEGSHRDGAQPRWQTVPRIDFHRRYAVYSKQTSRAAGGGGNGQVWLLTQRGSSVLTFPWSPLKKLEHRANTEEQSLMKLSFSKKCKES